MFIAARIIFLEYGDPLINILSNKRTSWYITHDIHNLLRVSAPRCHLQGVIIKRSVPANLPMYVLFVHINVIKTLNG
jgi:hypothetical protein